MTAAPHSIGYVLFDRYRIDAILPEGGFSRNYVATDTRDDRRVAIKQFNPDQFDESSLEIAKRMFREEAETLQKCGELHDRVPKCWRYVDECDGYPAIVQEFIDGDTYEQIARKAGAFDLDRALKFAQEFVPIVSTLHEAGLCHRDISPENVIHAAERDQPVLIDFGSTAKYQCGVGERDRTRVVKPGYCAPEQIETGEFSPQSDLYAIGCTLVFLLTGRDPDSFDRLPSGKLLWRSSVSASAQQHPAFVGFASAIDRSLSPSPLDRPASAQQFLDSLPATMAKKTEILSSSPEPGGRKTTIMPDGHTATGSYAPSPSPSPNRAPLFVASGVAACIIAGGVGIAALRGGDSTVEPTSAETPQLEAPNRLEEAEAEIPEPIASPEPSPDITPEPTPTPTATPQAVPTPSPVETNAPSSSYASPQPAPAPATSYGYGSSPSPSYGYDQPAPTYNPPAPTYNPPAPSYSLPSCDEIAFGACQ
ncbi:MAG: serine/threonine protein kinase [Geitlerinemataceae cyanobacterium]